MSQTLAVHQFASFIPPSRISQSASSSTQSTASASTFDTRRSTTRREGQFIYKHGQRHHSYDSEKAPYPLSYDRAVLDLESLENKFVQHLKGSISFVNFKQHPPQRVLDLGCGLGTWVIDAAKEWPDCEFVGFDLVNVQIPRSVLDHSTGQRIEWKHGNFLTTKLPFEDDEFDHVHVSMIAKAVPENKWGNLLEEISRVLAPGGSCEVVEDDVVFPILPRWFTQALRPKPRTSSVHLPNTLQHRDRSSTNRPPRDVFAHDHALLESLFQSVFEHRFINTKPTALLPSYFSTYFRQVQTGPVVHFPMPPLAPLQPLPPQIVTTYVFEPDTDTINARQSTYYPTPVPMARPVSRSFSSTSSYTHKTSVDSTVSRRPRTASSVTTMPDSPTTLVAPNGFLKAQLGEKEPTSPPSPAHPPSSPPEMPKKQFMLDNSLSEEVASAPQQLFPSEQLHKLSNRYLAMQLYRSCQYVLGCQEAMWEELKDRIRNRREELSPYGWDDDDELEELQSRNKFEKLIERFKTDMHLRISLWYSLTDIGWPFPEREPLTKAELVEEQRIRANMLEARKQARPEDFDIPSRSVRVLVGTKI
ncbi:hypothetical protein P691DRAFT_810855 [Macrolepiota fuliginosa MF-IS2]|uniref:Methyltransferase domain-containing protein n=1 Tax=Macrolepiota fuliginosa MF-IS2 TaxID=1400762 RepID=A0A9P5XPF8_9AGAR|nr:hypothetical protein P691DRAFT_810855 [Macrolepiota fuliginosa MF-IS2]